MTATSDKIKEMYDAGCSAAYISRMLGVKYQQVRYMGRLMGLDWRKSVFRDDVIGKMRTLAEEGKTYNEIAEELGLNRISMRVKMDSLGMKAKKDYNEWDEEQLAWVREKARSGMKCYELAKEMGISMQTIQAGLRKRGTTYLKLKKGNE